MLKLNDNHKGTPKEQEGHTLAQKFDLFFKAVTHNYNDITKHASTDLTVDKTTWAHGGH